ncbi:MAG TPA: FliI/YscN family ATPase [Candidatus Deferrimicrobiaceae bacterium]|jgi:flagellum-specific ATP synthase
MNLLAPYIAAVPKTRPVRKYGRITEIVGILAEGKGIASRIGSICEIVGSDGAPPLPAEVVGFREDSVLLMPIGEIGGIAPGSRIRECSSSAGNVRVGNALLGRVIDGLGNPIDGKGPLVLDMERPLHASAPHPLKRARITEPLDLGVRAINLFTTIGKGQRVGIFAGSGVGKSMLLGMIARHTSAQVNVLALIGERGREVREFIEKDLGEEALAHSVIIVSTSDQSAVQRIRGAQLATAVSEHFRDQGNDVLLMMDSLTRFAMALREVGLAAGEPPASKGYTPSVFAALPKLLERAGMSDHGSITGIYTVLVEGDDMNEPIADAARSILDGHITLTRALASRNHYPAIDVLQSASRVMRDIMPPDSVSLQGKAREVIANYRDAEDMVHIGAYVKGSDPKIDYALDRIDPVNGVLRQTPEERGGIEESVEMLAQALQE